MDKRTLRSKKTKPRSARPYDRQNQSIFGKVFSTVTGLLNPSRLISNVSHWMGHAEEEETGNSIDVERIVREDNDIVSHSSSHGNKRLRLRYEDHIPSIQSSGTQTWPDQPPSQSSYETVSHVQSSTSQSSLLETKEPLAVLNGDDHSENSEGSASTSGCSSLVSSTNRLVESPFQNTRSDMKRKRREPDTSKSRFTDVNSSRLWSREFSSPKFQRRLPTISNTNQPNFNLSTFMGPSKLNQSMENKVTSPFYEGNTTFGGASAARRMPSSVAPYQVDKTLRNQIKVREHQSNDNLEGMSSAAKRILLTLEKMSTPVADAKKIPNSSTSPVDLSLYLTPPKSRRNSQFTPSISKGPPIANINTIAKLATLKNYGVNRLRSTVAGEPVLPVEQKNVCLEILQPCSLEANSPKGGGGKMRTKINQHHLSVKDDGNDMPEAPTLPNVPLPITSLPTFKFGVSKPEKKNDSFTFSNPIEHDLSVNNAVLPTFPLPSSPFESKFEENNSRLKPFVFSNPILHELPDSGTLPRESASIPESDITLHKVSNPLATWECSSCWVRNPSYKTACMACETPQSSKKDISASGFTFKNMEYKPQVSTAVSESVSSPGSMFNTPKTTSLSISVPKINTENISAPKASTENVKSKPFSFVSGGSSSATWECSTCWVRNPEKESKCVACENLRPAVENWSSKNCSSSVPVLNISATWECSSCWIRNPMKESKCLACETDRPTKESSSGLTSTSVSISSSNSSTWECNSCWVKNPLKEKKCLACETSCSTEKPNSGICKTLSSPPSTWECSSCWVRNPVKEKKCLACETLQPDKDNTSGFKDVNGFKFSTPIQNSPITFKFGSLVCTVSSTSTTSTFKFGIATTSETTTTSSGFKFGVPSSTPVTSFFGTAASTTTTKTSETLPALLTATSSTEIPSIEISSAEVKQSGSSATTIETPQPTSNLNSSTQIKISEPSETPKMSSALTIPSQAVKSTESTSTHAVITSSSVATVSKEKEVPAPSVTACFGFTSQPVISSKKPETFNLLTTKEKPVSSVTPSFGTFPISSPSQGKSNEGEKVDHNDKNSEPKSTSVFQLPSQSFSTSSFTMPSNSAPLFKFGEKTDTSKVNPSATSAALTTTTSTTFTFDSGASTFGTVAKSKSSEIPSIAAAPLQQKSEDLKISKPTTFSSTTTTPAFAFGVAAAPVVTSAPSFSFFSSSAATTTPASSVFTFGASANTTQAAKSGGFTFKGLEKSQNSQTASSTSQPVAQGLNLGASATVSSGGFVFGAPKTEAQNSTPTSFVFGSNPTTTTAASNTSAFSAFQPSQPANPAFQFGTQPASSAPPSFGSTSSFAFAKSETSLVPSSSAQNPASAFGSTSNFSFGQKTETPTQINTTVSQTPVLAFGTSGNAFPFTNKNENAATPNPAGGFGSTSIPSVFGNASVPSFGAASDKPASGGFTFGAPASGIFQFGASNVDKKPAPSSGFSFGTPAAQETNNSFASGFTINTPPSFNFGASSTPAGPFQFAASTDAASGQSSAPRKYRKAVRRVLRRE